MFLLDLALDSSMLEKLVLGATLKQDVGPHCDFWRSNDCTSRAQWESLSLFTAETVERNVAHMGLVLGRRRKERVLRRLGSESEGFFYTKPCERTFEGCIDDLHTK